MKYIKNEDKYFGLINGKKVNLNSTKIEELKYIDSIENINNIDVNNYIFKIK